MTNGGTKHLFIDTNIALHYVRIDQVVWRDVTNHSSNVILIAPVVLRELDEKKFSAKTRKLQKRAEEYVKWLSAIYDSPELTSIRPDARIHLIAEEPTIDFSEHNFKNTIADDHLLASVLSHQNTENSAAAIVTSDIGLKIKAKNLGIEVIPLPDRFKLSTEPDETEKENLALKKELAEYKNRRPSLAIYAAGVKIPPLTENTEFPKDNVVSLKPPNIVSRSEYINRCIKKERKEHPFIKEINRNNATPNDVVVVDRNQKSITLKIDPEARERHDRLAADRYNEQLRNYYKDLETFLNQKYKAIVSRGCCYIIAAKACNNGTQLATNVNVIISFPNHIGVSDKWVSVTETAKPKPPTNPFPPSFLNTAKGFINSLYRDPITNIPSFHNPYKSGPHVKNNNKIWYCCDEIKHGFCTIFDNYYIVIPYNHDLSGFQATCSLSCNELPRPQEQILHFTFAAEQPDRGGEVN